MKIPDRFRHWLPLALTLFLGNPFALAADPGNIRISSTRPSFDADLAEGYRHLQAQAFAAAQLAYQAALRKDAHNTDALIALAVLAERQAQSQLAIDYWRRALRSDPLDPRAQAGLINLTEAADTRTESRLKNLLNGQTQAASLHFALGNLYARQNNWADAQAAYFNASSSEPNNPDYLYNLAVSLDHLGKQELARDHYQRALTAQQQQPAAFSTASLERRLHELTP